MGLFFYLAVAGFHLAALVLDLALVFVAVRLICCWRPCKILVAFDKVGVPLVDYVETSIDRLWSRVQPGRRLSARGKLCLAVLVLCVARLLINLVWLLVV